MGRLRRISSEPILGQLRSSHRPFPASGAAMPVTVPIPVRATHHSSRRSRRGLWWLPVIGAALYFLAGAAAPYLMRIDEATYGRFWPHAPWLLAHVVGGTVALVLGPLQFWSSVRLRYRDLHRWSGRLYLGGVAVAAPSAFYLSFQTSLFGFGVGLFTLGVLWSAATALAYVAIRNGQVKAHREWMIRSYVLTFTFVSFRLWLMLASMLELGEPRDVFPAVGWMSFVVPLFVTEVVLRWRETTTPVLRSARAAPEVPR